MKVFLVLASLVLLVRAEVGRVCSSDAECGDEECCQILSEFMVVSKRAESGTCQSYIQEGQPCDLFGKVNGFCSCFPGYACVADQVPINETETIIDRRDLMAPMPGFRYNIKCDKAEDAKVCTSDAECGDEECCQILSEFMVVSKRADTGTCEPYTQEGEPCDMYGKINGFCSCFPGYACQAVEIPLNDTQLIGKRKPPPPRPGYTYDIKCVKEAV